MTKRETMTALMEKLQNNVIFTNVSFTLNSRNNIHIQAPNSTTRYTIGTLESDHNQFWIRGMQRQSWAPCPYRLHYNGGDYTMNSADEVYNYFVNFWCKYKLNR